MPVVVPDEFWPRIVAAVKAVEASLAGSPAAARRRVGPGGRGGFFARVTGSTLIAVNRYRYTFEQVYKADAGYKHWETLPDGLTGDAYNLVEEMNDDSGVQGNGVTALPPPYEQIIDPCPDGNVVWMLPVLADDDAETWEYWFAWEFASC